MDDPCPSPRTVELDVCMMEDGWALLFHPSNELKTTIPEGKFTSLPSLLRSSPNRAPGTTPNKSASLSKANSPNRVTLTKAASGGGKVRTSLPPSFKQGMGLGAVNHVPLAERRKVTGPPPLRPVSLPPPTGPLPPVPVVPVASKRQSRIRFAEEDPRASALPQTAIVSTTTPPMSSDDEAVHQVQLRKPPAGVANLNETLRLRNALSSLQGRHAVLYDATVDARNEIARLRHELSRRKEVMDHLVGYAMSLRTENDILREQIPGERHDVMPYSQTSAANMEVILNQFGSED